MDSTHTSTTMASSPCAITRSGRSVVSPNLLLPPIFMRVTILLWRAVISALCFIQ